MTPRERLIATSRGGDVDRKPVICWPITCPESDVVVGSIATGDCIRLVPVLNPFGLALEKAFPLADTLAEDPDHGEKMLAKLVDQTRATIRKAFDHGADGVLYLLFGARAVHTTPMEYGGHYLERDRELLLEFAEATFNMIFVVGEDDAYLDFVSDLPAHAFGWDSVATGTSVSQMRELRQGALATNSPDANIELRFGTSGLSSELEIALQSPHPHFDSRDAHAV